MGWGVTLWLDETDRQIYSDAVESGLQDREVRLHFGHRKQMTEDAVRKAAFELPFIAEAFTATRAPYTAHRQAVHAELDAEKRLTRARGERHFHWRLSAIGCALVALAVWLIVADTTGLLKWYWGVISLGSTIVAMTAWTAYDQQSSRDVRGLWELACAYFGLLGSRSYASSVRQKWSRSLVQSAIVPQMRLSVRSLLGDDPDSLLIAGKHDGLKDVFDPQYHVETTAERQLKQKMDELDGGTIAICGPRGAGKSTLLRACSTQPSRALDLSVWMHAPADYAPQEFLLTLFGEVCKKYLCLVGESADVGVFVRIRKRRARALLTLLYTWTWRATLTAAFLLAAAYMFIAAYAAPVERFLRRKFTPQVLAQLRLDWRRSRDDVLAFWHHQPGFIGLGLLIASVAPLAPMLDRLVAMLGRLDHRKAPPSLVTKCQRYLLRLRTVQNAGATVTLGLPAVHGLSLGTTRATSMSSVPFTFPELVKEFRELLADIAAEQGENLGARVVIAIDELDRVGDAQQARKFLAQIKAVFGIENVYYLISVAEDVGAAFVRRGLPHRDVTDSSLDDLLYLPARGPEESAQLIALRFPDLKLPFIQLIHALSGGIPRDLIRYARRLIEVHRWTEHRELRDLAPALICDELAATLEGFRTLLAMREWTPDSAPLLTDVYALIQSLREVDEQNLGAVQTQVGALASKSTPQRADGEPSLEGETLALWQEASACCYFSLTLLEVFSAPGFDERRRQADAAGVNGRMQRLADARQELAVSPHSARILLEGIRTAWSL